MPAHTVPTTMPTLLPYPLANTVMTALTGTEAYSMGDAGKCPQSMI